jgi:hypothetical protein
VLTDLSGAQLLMVYGVLVILRCTAMPNTRSTLPGIGFPKMRPRMQVDGLGSLAMCIDSCGRSLQTLELTSFADLYGEPTPGCCTAV